MAKLLLGLVNLADEVNEALARFWDALLGPVSELELAHRPRLTVLGKGVTNNLFIAYIITSEMIFYALLFPRLFSR